MEFLSLRIDQKFKRDPARAFHLVKGVSPYITYFSPMISFFSVRLTMRPLRPLNAPSNSFVNFQGWAKLNTDGWAAGSPGQAGTGGVLRDHRGGWISGLGRHLGKTNSILAECWALQEGLKMAKDKGIQFLEVELDAQDADPAAREPPNEAHLP
ncbi:hypothetical protein CRG98_007969 [Punica granatum]|uniref:RNase H type-1 domain-containing protein n=1 Tax=Punica granatum TaxID=22663 RepID=A0A2I0KUX6_PUNGR|nr:hypothetical protein CRG98_007969 [Punica granatum]